MTAKKILTVIDPEAVDQTAQGRAATLAQALGASLELFICDYDQDLAGGRFFDSKGLEKARRSLLENHVERLEKLAAPLAAAGFEVSVDARWAKPLHHGIVGKVLDSQPVLVVKDTHFHAALRRTLLSNTDWNLIRACPAPLVLVKPRALADVPKILAAVDPLHEHDKPAELDRSILACAKELATAVHGELHVLHAYDAAPVLAAASDAPVAAMPVSAVDLIHGIERAHRRALEELLAGYPVAREHVHLEEGVPSRVLVKTAEERKIDFVVMGAVSRGGLRRIFLGSTAERVLDRLPCDLIVVKPAGFVAPQLRSA